MRRVALALVAAASLSCAYVHGSVSLSDGLGGGREFQPERCSVFDLGTGIMLSSPEDPVWALRVGAAPTIASVPSVLSPPNTLALDFVDLTRRSGQRVHLAAAQCRVLSLTAEHNAFTVRVNGGPRRFYYGGFLDLDCDDPVTQQRLAGRVTFNYCPAL